MIVQLTKVEDDKMYFTSAYNIKAGVPYLVKPERTVETPYFTYENNIVVENEPVVTDFDGIKLVGNFTPHEWNSADEYYYGVKSNNIIKAKESTAALKGMRGYFVIPQGRKAIIYIGDNFTGISETVEESLPSCSASHLPVFFCSAKTTFNIFKSFILLQYIGVFRKFNTRRAESI